MKVFGDFTALIGKTPLLRAARFERARGIDSAELFVKLECMNPTGSAKDRAALYMINEAEANGLLKKGGTIIEPTSGNTGIGIAAIAAARGYKAVIVMPDTMSAERRAMMSAYGAKVVLTDGKLGMRGSIEKANELQKNTENAVILGQFINKANAKAHYETTGPEIYEALGGKIDVFVSCIGTGGTISGVGRYLKEKNSDIQIIGVEPAGSPLITKGFSAPHKIEGIGANFIPDILDMSVIDRVICVSDSDAFAGGKLFANTEGVLVGISSGAALSAAEALSRESAYIGKRIVALLPDSGNRYLSTSMYE